MNGVLTIGLANDARGLAQALPEFRSHHKRVGDALLNISGIGTADGAPVEVETERPAYDPKDPRNQWPRMIYHADGREQIVMDAKELKEFQDKGFRKEPYPKVQIALEDPKVEKQRLQQQLAEKDGQIAMLTERFNQLEQRLNDAAKADSK